jgi:hypothetical protein
VEECHAPDAGIMTRVYERLPSVQLARRRHLLTAAVGFYVPRGRKEEGGSHQALRLYTSKSCSLFSPANHLIPSVSSFHPSLAASSSLR